MKKKVLLLIIIGTSSLYFAQVGINKANPNLSADLELGSQNKTLILNRVPNTAAVSIPADGMMIYDISEECIKVFQSGKWSKCLGKGLLKTSNSLALVCSSAIISPLPVIGQSYKGVLTIPYTGGNGISYQSQHLQTNGLTAVVPAGNFAKGSGSLQYSVTGTPIKADHTIFNIDIAGSNCTVTSVK